MRRNRYDWFDLSYKAAQTAASRVIKEMNTQFEKLETKASGLEQQLTDISKRVTQISQQLTDIQTAINKMKEEAARIA